MKCQVLFSLKNNEKNKQTKKKKQYLKMSLAAVVIGAFWDNWSFVIKQIVGVCALNV